MFPKFPEERRPVSTEASKVPYHEPPIKKIYLLRVSYSFLFRKRLSPSVVAFITRLHNDNTVPYAVPKIFYEHRQERDQLIVVFAFVDILAYLKNPRYWAFFFD